MPGRYVKPVAGALAVTLALASTSALGDPRYYYRNVQPAPQGSPVPPPPGGSANDGGSLPGQASLALSGAPTAPAAVGGRIGVSFVPSGFPGTVALAQSGPDVPGLAFSPETGELSGTLSSVGQWTFTVTATGGGRTASASLTIQVLPPAPQAVVQTQPSFLVAGVGFTARLAGADGTSLSGWKLTEGPAWLSLGAEDGVLASGPSAATESFAFAAVGYDAYGRGAPVSGSYALAAPEVSLDVPAAPVPGDSVAVAVATNLPSPTLSWSGAPSWLAVASPGSVTAIVSQPDRPTRYSGTLTATRDRATASAPFDVTVAPIVVTALLPSTARQGATLAGTISADRGAGWSYSLDGAPPWLTTATDGTISASVPGSATTVTGIRAKASRNGVEVLSAPFSVNVVAPPSYATQPGNITVAQAATANVTATLATGGYVDPKRSWQVVATTDTSVPSWLSAASCPLSGPSCSVVASPGSGVAVGSYGPYALRMVDGAGAQLDSAPFNVTVQPLGNLASTTRPTSIAAGSDAASKLAGNTVQAAYDRNLSGVIMGWSSIASSPNTKYMKATYPSVYADGCYVAARIAPKTSITFTVNAQHPNNNVTTYATVSDASGLAVASYDCGLGQGAYIANVNWWATGYTGAIDYVEARLTYGGVSAP